MSSLRWLITLWFAASVLGVVAIYSCVTYFHLRHELRFEKWERAHPEHSDWKLHGSYSESEVADIAGELLRLSLYYAIPLILFAGGIGFLLARRSLATVEDLNLQLREIGPTSLGKRVKLRRADREFNAIEANINSLLARLEVSFSQLNEYSANVAHELRTPLTLLRLKVDEVACSLEPDTAEVLQEELARLTDYVDQSLLLAKAEQGRLQVDLREVNLRPLLEEMIEGYQIWAGQAQRSVAFRALEDPVVLAERRYLKQILHNLLTNAVKHGVGTIEVSLAGEGNEVVCQIQNGFRPPGLSSAGTGMGLRIANALTQVLGCRLRTYQGVDAYVADLRWPMVVPAMRSTKAG